MAGGALGPVTGLGVDAVVHQRNPPGIGPVAGVGDLPLPNVHRHIGPMKNIICKTLLDDVALLAHADDEIRPAEGCV